MSVQLPDLDGMPEEMLKALDRTGVIELRNGQYQRTKTGLDELAFVDPASLQNVEPPVREWLVKDWLPIGCVTSLYGSGGTGKSLLAMQVATAIATGTSFFGYNTAKSPVIGVYCEDDNDELHRRQNAINAAADITLQRDGGLYWLGRTGENNFLVEYDENGGQRPAELFKNILKAAKETGARLIILDNIAQMFPGNENDRIQVTAFVNLLVWLAKDIDGAVLLLGHPGKGGAATEYSGSTAWDAAVRSRWFLKRPEADEEDEEPSAFERQLVRTKSNYSAINESIDLIWDNGALIARLPTVPLLNKVDRIDRNNRENAAKVAFLNALEELKAQGKAASDSTNAGNYALKILPQTKACKGFKRPELKRAMDQLFRDAEIFAGENVCRRGDRKWRIGIVRSEWKMQENCPRQGAPRLRHGSETMAHLTPSKTEERPECAKVSKNDAPRCATVHNKPSENNELNMRQGAPHCVPISKDISPGGPNGVPPVQIDNSKENGPGSTL